MSKNWIVLQLSDYGETTLENDPKEIETIINRVFSKRVDYFIPVHWNKSKDYFGRIYLIKGYIFLNYLEELYPFYRKIFDSKLFYGPLMTSDNKLSFVSELEIKNLKKQLESLTQPKIQLGDKVTVVDGKYKNLTAHVTEIYQKEKEVDLSVELKCMKIIVPRIPIVCLTKLANREELPAVKISLQEKITRVLKEHVDGLTRKGFIDILKLDKDEKDRLSTCLSRLVQKKVLKCRGKKQQTHFKLI